MKRFVIAGVGVLVLVAIIAVAAASQFTLSALPEPGRTETALATKAKHYLVHRSSREGIPPAPVDRQASIKEGDRLFGTECAACHGASGHNPTDAGRWMYPRVADLTSRDVQAYSEPEVFWIIKNGIRFETSPGVKNRSNSGGLYETEFWKSHPRRIYRNSGDYRDDVLRFAHDGRENGHRRQPR